MRKSTFAVVLLALLVAGCNTEVSEDEVVMIQPETPAVTCPPQNCPMMADAQKANCPMKADAEKANCPMKADAEKANCPMKADTPSASCPTGAAM